MNKEELFEMFQEGIFGNVNIDITSSIGRVREKELKVFPTKKCTNDVEIFPKVGEEKVIPIKALNPNIVYFNDHKNQYHENLESGRVLFNIKNKWYYFDIGAMNKKYEYLDAHDIEKHIFNFINKKRS